MDLIEQLLLEKSRAELISKSQNADVVKKYGTTRWEGRNRVSAMTTIRNYNKLDMNSLFKADLLNLIIPIKGETNDYSVEVLFEGVCKKIREELKRNNFKLEYKVIYRAIINAVNAGDILVACTCPDWKFRQAYQGTMGKYNAGKPELRPAKITNPNDTKGAGCKHVMNVLGNLDWAMRLAVCINNYILFMKDNYNDLFMHIIWPAISGRMYWVDDEEVSSTELTNTMPTENSEGNIEEPDTTEIDTANDSRLRYDIPDEDSEGVENA